MLLMARTTLPIMQQGSLFLQSHPVPWQWLSITGGHVKHLFQRWNMSNGLRTSELIQSSISSLQPPWLWSCHPKSHQLFICPARFFQIDIGIQHRSETKCRSLRLSASSCANDICFQSTHVPFSPLYWKNLQMPLEILFLLFIMKKIL